MNSIFSVFMVSCILSVTTSYAMEDKRRNEEPHKPSEYRSYAEKYDLWQELGLTYSITNDYHSEYEGRNVLDFDQFHDEFQQPLARLLKRHLDQQQAAEPNAPRRFFALPLDSECKSPLPDLVVAMLKEARNHVVIHRAHDHEYVDNTIIKYVEKIGGYGAFAARDFEPNEIIGEYIGRVLYASTSLGVSHDCDSKGYGYGPVEKMRFPTGGNDTYLMILAFQHPFFLLKDSAAEFRGMAKVALVVDAQEIRNEMALANHSPRFANAESIAAIKVTYAKNKNDEFLVHVAEFAMYLRAKTAIKSGEEILYDYGYGANTIKKKNMRFLDLRPTKTCYGCNQDISGKNWTCSRCKTALYCSVTCQKIDWNTHKAFCHNLNDREKN